MLHRNEVKGGYALTNVSSKSKHGGGWAFVRGRKRKEEVFLTTDSIYTTKTKNLFKVKGLCKVSMKKDLRKVSVSTNRATSMVSSAVCSCPTGKSRYCKHAMALLIDFANYSLRGLKEFLKKKLVQV